MARLVQRQNEERLRLETEMKRRRTEIRKKKMEMLQIKILVEDQRNQNQKLYQNQTSDAELSNLENHLSQKSLRAKKTSSSPRSKPRTFNFQACGSPSSEVSHRQAEKVNCLAEGNTSYGLRRQLEPISVNHLSSSKVPDSFHQEYKPKTLPSTDVPTHPEMSYTNQNHAAV